MTKNLTKLLVICLLVCGLSGLSKANEIRPLWLYTASITPSLTFISGYAYARIDVTGHMSVTEITGTLYLDEKVNGAWVNKGSWDASVIGRILGFTAPGVKAISQTDYRVRYDGFVLSNSGGFEPIYCSMIRTSP